MKERPILYSAPMVLAKLRPVNPKTQTRRILKAPHLEEADRFSFDPERGEWEMGECHQGPTAHVGWVQCPYGVPGDRLWGRETFAVAHEHHKDMDFKRALEDARKGMPWAQIVFRADAIGGWAASHLVDEKWRPSIFMPRWASRILDEVVSVRVERLQDISEEDALAEGLEEDEEADERSVMYRWPGGAELFYNPRDCYLAGWDTINAKRAPASSNPWVWRIETKPVV